MQWILCLNLWGHNLLISSCAYFLAYLFAGDLHWGEHKSPARPRNHYSLVPSPCTRGRCRGLIVAVDISILSSDTSPFITNMDLLSPNTTLISTSHSCRSVADKMVRKTLISSTSKISWTIIITGLSWRGHAHFVGKPTSVWLFPINACIYILHVNILSDSGV